MFRDPTRAHTVSQRWYMWVCRQGSCPSMSALCVGNSSWHGSSKSGGLGGACWQKQWHWSIQDSIAGWDIFSVLLLSWVHRNGTDLFIMCNYVGGHLLDPVCWQAWKSSVRRLLSLWGSGTSGWNKSWVFIAHSACWVWGYRNMLSW
jgi:hypothetical protein